MARLRHKMSSEDGITVCQNLQITSATKSANRVTRCNAENYYSISSNSTHINGAHVPVEEASTASIADVVPAVRTECSPLITAIGPARGPPTYHLWPPLDSFPLRKVKEIALGLVCFNFLVENHSKVKRRFS
jgi:hypothetical protein